MKGKRRKRIIGTSERPRLSVYRSLSHIYAQLIDDISGRTLVASSTREKHMPKKTANIEAAKKVGTVIAKKALEKGIKKVVFDRGGFRYHGKIKALADCAREGGLDF